jgi:hypothetical protein
MGEDNYASSPAMSSCRAANVSTSRAGDLPVLIATAGHQRCGFRSKFAVEPQLKIYPEGEEPPRAHHVDWVAPGEAPQPLTLNLPALNPGRESGRGSTF